MMHLSLWLWSAYGRWSDALVGLKSERDALRKHPQKEPTVEPEDKNDDHHRFHPPAYSQQNPIRICIDA
jgi:hypothetical protein